MKRILLTYSLVLAILWTVIILILCSTPGRFIPTTSWLELLSFDKFVHASIFFILLTLWLIYFLQKKWNNIYNILFLLMCCIGYGGLLEIMQSTLFSQRSGDWLDFIANSFGCIMGGLFFGKIKKQIPEI